MFLWYLTVRPAPARFPAVKRLMPAAGSMDVKRMRMASAVMPAQPHTPTSTVSASSSMENQHQNPISVLNQYKAGLNYHVIGEYGPPHLKNFTVEVTVDDQVGAIRYCVCTFKRFLGKSNSTGPVSLKLFRNIFNLQ